MVMEDAYSFFEYSANTQNQADKTKIRESH